MKHAICEDILLELYDNESKQEIHLLIPTFGGNTQNRDGHNKTHLYKDWYPSAAILFSVFWPIRD